jgi:ubiquinone/menaquinone biosynthesis C-methylase UbiE
MSQTQYQTSEAVQRMDWINRRAWSAPATVRSFRDREGWTDPGERAAVDAARAGAAHEPILDLGVGAGRTVSLLRSISEDYVGLDYTPELVEACRRKHPGVHIVQGDARDLSQFASGSLQLVVFSFNGIDAVNPADRSTILREVERVLRPGGAFLFSAHNREGPGYSGKLSFEINRTRNPLKLAWRFVLAMLRAARTMRNYKSYSKLSYDGDGCSIRNASAHSHGILVHYVTLENQLKQLESHGFGGPALAWASSDGRRLSPGDDTSDAWWFHVLTCK